jgi:hypothetical protein
MATTEMEILELYRISLTNAASQPVIAQIMDEFGYGPEKLAEGQAMVAEVRAAFDNRNTERSEALAAYRDFETKWDELSDRYALHRRKAKAAFNKVPGIAERLAILGSMPRTYAKWMDTVRTFYTVSLSDPEIQQGMTRVKLSTEDLNAAYALLPAIEEARANYIREKGESQHATKLKDAAFARLEEWMREFYTIAKIALEESPQLAESLGRLVRS